MRSMSASSSLVGTIPFRIRRRHRDQSLGMEGFLNPRTPSSRPGLRTRVSSSRGMIPFESETPWQFGTMTRWSVKTARDRKVRNHR
jgi:hypothetical protein